MAHHHFVRPALVSLVPLLILSCLPAAGVEPAKSTPKISEIVLARPFRPRLPRYYGLVVDQKQRTAIYAIQKEYHAEIEALRVKLAQLTAERDAKVKSVLTREQQQKVAEAIAAANAKRSGTTPKEPAKKE